MKHTRVELEKALQSYEKAGDAEGVKIIRYLMDIFIMGLITKTPFLEMVRYNYEILEDFDKCSRYYKAIGWYSNLLLNDKEENYSR